MIRKLTCFAWLLALFLLSGCAFSVAPTNNEESALTITLSAYPAQLSAQDTAATAEVWATVLQGAAPVADGTRVKFASTAGTITGESQTQDGLAVAVLVSPGDGRPRRAAIVAQALTVRDTLDLDFILDDDGF